ncbi:MAG: rubredoxin [Candidatus Krumholzibacteria bacterium]|nr:rubredoxin [Candidatus Krumholzibacteria bacterium]
MRECLDCSYCYVPAEGAPARGISPGTPFDDLPDDFTCPSCGASRERFVPLIHDRISSL